jgi:hypothetical protein
MNAIMELKARMEEKLRLLENKMTSLSVRSEVRLATLSN